MSWPPSSGGTVNPAYVGSNICVLGDSIGAQESEIKNGVELYTKTRGAVVCMLTKLGHPWNFEPSDNFAVDGYNAKLVIENKLQPLLAAHATRKYTRCFISLGTNDTNSADAVTPNFTFEEIQANFMTIFTALRGAGIIPVHRGVKPRGNDGALTKAKQQNMRLTQWLYQLAVTTGMIEFIDTTSIYADTTSAYGNSLAGMTYDTVHPNGTGGFLEGGVMADYYRARGVGPGLVFATSQADVFDRINNPYGVAFDAANPLMLNPTTVTAGARPAGMSIASPAAGAWTTVNRTLPNGAVRTDPRVAFSSAGTYYLYDDWNATGAWSASQLQPGDVVEVRAKVVLAGVTNVPNIYIRMAENDGTTGNAHYGMFSQDITVPLQFAAEETLYLKGPRVTIRPWSGSGSQSVFARVEAVALANATGTCTIQAFEMRKVN